MKVRVYYFGNARPVRTLSFTRIEYEKRRYRKFFLLFANYAYCKDYNLDGSRGLKEGELDEGKESGETQVL